MQKLWFVFKKVKGDINEKKNLKCSSKNFNIIGEEIKFKMSI